jgi:polyphosphate kinase 2
VSDLDRTFDLDEPKLPDAIKEASLTSGGFPYTDKLSKSDYEPALYAVQVQLVALQSHLLESGERIVILFEGRDAAGKSGAIGTYKEHLNPRNTISAALPKPNDREATQWYFQRYIDLLPAGGETVLFDRSWYNRSGVELVMGFCTPQQGEKFLEEAPRFEKMVVSDGIRLFKFWLSIGREMQLRRFHDRRHDPLKQWKLSPVDLKSLTLWDAYTTAGERTLAATDTPQAPWTVVLANDERRARLNMIRTVLSSLDYKGKDNDAIGEIDRKIALSADNFLSQRRGGRR